MSGHAPLLLDVSRLIWRRWRGRQPTGIDRVCLAYLDHFRESAQAVVQHRHARRILHPGASKTLFELLARPRAHFRRDFVAGALRFSFDGQDRGRNRFYLNVGHTGLDQEGFRTWVDHADVRPIYLVHDLIPITHPEFCRPGESAKHRRRMRTVLTTGTGVIANSKSTLDDLASFASNQELNVPLMLPALLGSDAIPTFAPKIKAETPMFVILGTIEARKNHLMILKIWERFVARLGPNAPKLLIIGQRGWECDQTFELLDRSQMLKEAVREIGHCSDAELARHLATARALLFPSLVEGFGLPLVEALRSGTPVIASDLPAFREIAGDIPDYLDPRDDTAWEGSILAYGSGRSVARAAQVRRMAGFRPPTWHDHFTAVDNWLGTL